MRKQIDGEDGRPTIAAIALSQPPARQGLRRVETLIVVMPIWRAGFKLTPRSSR